MSETRTTRTTTTAGKAKTTTTTTTTDGNLNKMNESLSSGSSVASTTLLGTSSKLLLKNQLHLNLNVISNENTQRSVDSQYKRSRGICKLPSKADETVEATNAEVLSFKDDVSNLETTTVTTVPQIQQKQQQQQQQQSIIEASKSSILSSVAAAAAAASSSLSLSSSSLLNSSPSALAKFNRIIDSTMPTTDCYQQEQSQNGEKLQEIGIFTTIDSKKNRKINFPSGYDCDDDDVGLDYKLDNVDVTKVVKENDDEVVVPHAEHEIDEKDDNQMKRNDVHYLLKQLNSFSDIEEIEIVDMKQNRQQQAVTARVLATATAAVITHSPTTTSLVIISPSSQSHKESRHVMRRFASLHQQHQYENQHENHHHHREQQQSEHRNRRHYSTLNASGGNLLDPATEQQYLLQQFDDYLFESCHYLETNYFATTYRTAMIESSSHEFRPSTTTGTRSSPSAASSPHSYEIHEIELPSVICRAPPPPPSPTRRFNTQARLTSSGVQTELTASSLTSTTTTKTSHAAASQSITKSSSGVSACSSCTSSTEQRRRMPFFKCCYASINRWREKRNAGSSANGAGGTFSLQKTRIRNTTEDADVIDSVSRHGSQRKQQKKQNTTARKSGSDV